MLSQIVLRTAQNEDVPFITDSWIRSYRNLSPTYSKIPTGFWFSNHGKTVNKVITSPNVNVIVATNDDLICGYIVYEMIQEWIPVLHYVLLKSHVRDFKISRMLMDVFLKETDKDIPVNLTHLTQDFIKRYYNNKESNRKFVFNPFLLKELGYEKD